MSQREAEEIAIETIQYWRVRGVTATVAWQALGHKSTQTNWAPVRAFMIRWLLSQDVECHGVKRAA